MGLFCRRTNLKFEILSHVSSSLETFAFMGLTRQIDISPDHPGSLSGIFNSTALGMLRCEGCPVNIHGRIELPLNNTVHHGSVFT